MQRHLILAAAVIVLVLFLGDFNHNAIALQVQKGQQTNQKQKNTVYTDEFNELDESDTSHQSNEFIHKDFKIAEQYYHKAIDFIKHGDTLVAKRFFNASINVLNKLASIPGIEQFESYYSLVQSVKNDYTAYFPNADDFDMDSPQFLIFDKVSQEKNNNNNSNTNNQPNFQPLEYKKDTAVASTAQAPSFLVFTDNVIPLDDNEYVQKMIGTLMTGKLLTYYKAWLERTTRWFPLLKRIIQQENMPKEIIYLAMIESGLNPTVPSRAKAIGMWQFIRSTGELYGLNAQPSIWVDDRRNPEKATYAAMHHLRDLYNELGDWHLVLAAYNCGLACVQRAIAKSKLDKPNFWDIRQYLPKETKLYVPTYIAASRITMNPEAYGIKLSELKFQDEFKFDTFSVKEPVSLTAISKCAGVSIEEIQALNTELIKNTTPPDVKEYILKIPLGSRQEFIARFATLSDQEKQPWITHIVRRKESLRSIASMYGVSEDEIASVNDISSAKRKLKVGATLRIPIEQQETKPVSTFATQQIVSSDSSKIVVKKTQNPAPAKKKPEYTYYKVKKGENLTKIATRYGLSLTELCEINDINPDKIHLKAGTQLKVPNNNSKNLANSGKTNTSKIIKHKVKSGETLAQIADDYNVSIDDLKKINKLGSSKIKKGQIIKVETGQIASKKSSEENDYLENEKSSKLVVHKVKNGENLGTIAARYGVSESQIKKWNPDKIEGSTIFGGTRLKIYTNVASKGSSAAPSKKVNDLPKSYKVKKGDSLASIAQKFGVTINQLKKKNKNLNDKNLMAGQKIRIQ